jgi:hypothetical protein
MPVGTAIFLGALVVSVSIVFAATKDRWNWRRIAKWGALVPAGVAALLVGAFVLYTLWDSRQQSLAPLVSFGDIPLSATQADVLFLKGKPSKESSPDLWIYSAHIDRKSLNAAQYIVVFKDGRVRYVAYGDESGYTIGSSPYALGLLQLASSYQEVVDRLGDPSHVANSPDQLARVLSYDKYNAFFYLQEGRVFAYGMYQPADGPMSFPAK